MVYSSCLFFSWSRKTIFLNFQLGSEQFWKFFVGQICFEIKHKCSAKLLYEKNVPLEFTQHEISPEMNRSYEDPYVGSNCALSNQIILAILRGLSIVQRGEAPTLGGITEARPFCSKKGLSCKT